MSRMSDLIPLHLSWLRAGGRSERTIHDRQRLLHHADAHLPYGLDNAHTDEWAEYLSHPGWSKWTRHTYFHHGNGYYDWAVACEHITINPMAALIRPPEGDRIPDPASDGELAHALTVLPEQPWRMAVLLAAYQGLRCCEIVTIRREHCTATHIRVRGKGGRVATVPTHPAVWAAVAHRPPGLLVTGARGGPLTAQMLTQMQGAVWRRIGQPDQHLHRFRHWYATSLLAAGADLVTVRDLLRQRSIHSTVGYTAVVDTRRRAAVALLPTVAISGGAPAGLYPAGAHATPGRTFSMTDPHVCDVG